jgi:hypothetical protein
MGVDYRGLAVVGIRVKQSDLTITTRVKTFSHNHPEHWKVDPETGKALWRDRKTSVFGEDFEYGYDKLPGNLQTFSGSGYDDDPDIFIGRGISSDSNRSGGSSAMLPIDLKDLGKITEDLHKLLDPLKLSVNIEGNLGIWAVLSAS